MSPVLTFLSTFHPQHYVFHVNMKYSTLCTICTRALHFDQISWEDEKRNGSMWPMRRHHSSLESFRKAALYKCYICSRVWDMLTSGKATEDEHQPCWKDGSEVDWDGMHYLVQHDHDWPTILFMVICPGSKEHSHYVPFQLMPRNDSRWVRYDARPALSSSTSSASTLRLISKWLKSCQRSHISSGCRQNVRTWQPTRLLDIGRSGDEKCKIVLQSQNPNKTRPYITLSYRWDAAKQPRLLSSNINSYLRGLAIESLPKTFRDTIFVARALGVRYLWIDALCIIQDSHEDWERESAYMGLVYANGLCNIAASASAGPDGGLFRFRNPDSTRPGHIRANPLPDTCSQTYNIIDTLYTHRQLRYTPFFRRGWIFQERMLASRVIYFAEEQVFWECRAELKCEAFPAGIPFASSFKSLLPETSTNSITCLWWRTRMLCTIFRQWNSIVQDYTGSQFTFVSDKLAAFMGIASYFKPFIDSEYAFGMWSAGLEKQLGFSIERPVIKRSLDYRAPSWSWASLDGPVQYNYLHSKQPLRTSIHVKIEENGFAQGLLHLQGVLTPVTYSHSTSTRKSKVTLENGTDLDLILLKDHLGVDFVQGERLTLLAFESSRHPCPSLHCLILEPILCTLQVHTIGESGLPMYSNKKDWNLNYLKKKNSVPLGLHLLIMRLALRYRDVRTWLLSNHSTSTMWQWATMLV